MPIIQSSHGHIIANELGRVVSRHSHNPSDPDNCLEQIDRFNVAEWEHHYNKPFATMDEIDILDLGYWMMHSGIYEEPDHDWRAEFAQWYHKQHSKSPIEKG